MRPLIAAVALGFAPAALAQSGEWTAGVGLHYSSGDYGTSRTTQILALPLTATYAREPWTVKLTLPIYSVSGGASVIPGFGAVDGGNRRGRGGAEGSATGLGDATIAVTSSAYYNAAAKLGLDLTGKLKLPTGEESKGLGSGSTDATIQADAYKGIDRLTLFGGVGYTIFGSSFVQFENAVGYNLGAGYRIDASDTAGVSYDARTRLAPGSPAQRELTLYYTRAFDRQWKGQAYVMKGLADGSPDIGIGVSAARAF